MVLLGLKQEPLQEKMMIEFILLVSLSGMPSGNVYAGSFSSCQEAFAYADVHYSNWRGRTCVREISNV